VPVTERTIKVLRRRRGRLTIVEIKRPEVKVGDDLHEMYYEKGDDGEMELKSHYFIDKQRMPRRGIG